MNGRASLVKRWANLLATLAVIVVNSLASTVRLNGVTTGEISDRFDVYFVPAGYVFSIWGVIYLFLLGFSVYQLLPAQSQNPRLNSIGYLYVLSCVANIAWLLFWHYGYFVLTVVVMIALLLVLIAIYLRLGIGRSRVPASETWLVRVPFSIYLGWITVATIANVTSTLDYLNWSGWGIAPETWAVLMLVAGAAIASVVGLTRGDIAFVLVIVWAFVGITVKQAGTPLVAVTAAVMALVVAATLVVGVPRTRRRLVGAAEAKENLGSQR